MNPGNLVMGFVLLNNVPRMTTSTLKIGSGLQSVHRVITHTLAILVFAICFNAPLFAQTDSASAVYLHIWGPKEAGIGQTFSVTLTTKNGMRLFFPDYTTTIPNPTIIFVNDPQHPLPLREFDSARLKIEFNMKTGSIGVLQWMNPVNSNFSFSNGNKRLNIPLAFDMKILFDSTRSNNYAGYEYTFILPAGLHYKRK